MYPQHPMFELPTKQLKLVAAALLKENRKYADKLRRLPEKEFADQASRASKPLIAVWRSNKFLVQVYDEGDHWRLSVCRSEVDVAARRFKDGISWEQMQELKTQAGFGAYDAVEVYPAQKDEVNVANMRHLWVMKYGELPFAWRRK